MGQSTDAILFYGYCWTDEGSPPWRDEDEDEDEDDRYVRLAGFDEEWTSGDDGYFKRKAKVLAKATGKIVRHCSGDCTMYGVAVKGTVMRAWRGDPQEIDPAKMNPKPEWAENLRVYCEHMGIDPGDQKPAWHLVSWWC